MRQPPHEVDAQVPPGAVDWLVLNELELDQLCAARAVTGAAPVQRALQLAALLGVDVALTLGRKGALTAGRDGRCLTQPALAVEVVDTTGAGDTFTGVLGTALVSGLAEPAALGAAVVAASLACRHAGAQAAQPGRQQIDAAL
jgi:ribokinase